MRWHLCDVLEKPGELWRQKADLGLPGAGWGPEQGSWGDFWGSLMCTT